MIYMLSNMAAIRYPVDMSVKNILATSAIFTASVIMVFGFIEITFRALDPMPVDLWRFSPITSWLPVSNVSGTYKRREFAARFEFNSLGLRGPEMEMKKPEGEVRVMFTGDSYTEALQVEYDEGYVVVSEKLLKGKTGKHIRAVNMGVSGFGTVQSLARFESLGVSLAPDALFHLVCSNDFADNLRSKVRKIYRLNGGTEIELTPVRVSFFTRQLIMVKDFLKHHFQLYRQVKWRWDRLLGKAGKKERIVEGEGGFSLDEKEKRVFESTLAKMSKVSADLGIPFFVAYIPDKKREKDRWAGEYLESLASRLKFVYIDLVTPFYEHPGGIDPLYYKIDGHWNARGHKLAAELISEKLAEAL